MTARQQDGLFGGEGQAFTRRRIGVIDLPAEVDAFEHAVQEFSGVFRQRGVESARQASRHASLKWFDSGIQWKRQFTSQYDAVPPGGFDRYRPVFFVRILMS